MDRRNIGVIGVGNPLMGDDGAGIAVLRLLRATPVPGIDLVDGGTGGLALVHLLAEYDAVVIADAIDMGLKPGTVKAFSPDDIVPINKRKRLSLHDSDVFEAIRLARHLGECPTRLTICGMQPKRICPRAALSREIRLRLPAMAEQVVETIRKAACAA